MTCQLPEQCDVFVADIFRPAPKDDVASMEHPLFALRAGDRRVRTYTRNGTTVVVEPGVHGCATIHDKDVWIYCITQLVAGLNCGREVGRTVRFRGGDFLNATGRPVAGVGYRRLVRALERLKGTVVRTNIETDATRERAGFGLIDAWRVVERDHGNRMVAVEVTLPDWLWRSVRARHVLTVSRDYFRLRKPLARRIYELARKHCGAQPKWRISLNTLRDKCGSTDTERKFRAALKVIAGVNELPDYRLAFDGEADVVTVYARCSRGQIAQVSDLVDALSKEPKAAVCG